MIDPDLITTVRVGELPPAGFNLTDEIPHEIGEELKKGTVQQLADVIGTYLGSIGGLSFNPTTVSDGQTLPTTTGNQWMLIGKGTFPNVGGGATIVTTEELNALTSNGVFWSLAVEIPVNVELAGITQNIRSGYTQTVPSENAVYLALQNKADVNDIIPYSPLKTLDNGIVLTEPKQVFTLPDGATCEMVFINESLVTNTTNTAFVSRWSQTGNNVTLSKTTAINNRIVILYREKINTSIGIFVDEFADEFE